MLANVETSPKFIQGTPEWFDLRKTKITATDASVIMGVSPWKTRLQLYQQKISPTVYEAPNAQQQRGLDLEPVARDFFIALTGVEVFPKVVVKDWMMASLDGINKYGTVLVEIKCPGPTDHAIALSKKVPDHYYPQLQHQMYVCGLKEMYYFSFDGNDGVIVSVEFDQKYCQIMIDEEKKFYDSIINRIPPEPSENDYQERNDDEWQRYSSRWKALNDYIKSFQEEEAIIREKLIELSGQSNCKGAGIKLCQFLRKGNVDYSSIPELKNVDLDKYRKPSTKLWRISCE